MIVSLLLAVGAAIITLFAAAFGLLNWQLPAQIPAAIFTVFGVIHQLFMFVPFVGTIIAVYLIVAPMWVTRYIINIILWMWSLVPFIGGHVELPGLHSLDLRGNTSRRVLDLREGRRPKSPKHKTMRDIV